MDISQEEAQESLGQIDDVVARTKKMAAYAGADTIFVVWGVIWVLGYLNTHFLPIIAGGTLGDLGISLAIVWTWTILVVAGIVASILVGRRKAPVKSPIGKRIGVFWGLLYVYVDLWLFLVYPFVVVSGHEQSAQFWNHLGAIAATVPMFAYVVTGLLLDHFMIWIGLAVTALTILGLFVLPAYFFIWMAVVGGGTLIGTGLFIRNRWR